LTATSKLTMMRRAIAACRKECTAMLGNARRASLDPDAAKSAAQAQGKERYEAFEQSLARKPETGSRIAVDVADRKF
jgi:glutathione S-transferase